MSVYNLIFLLVWVASFMAGKYRFSFLLCPSLPTPSAAASVSSEVDAGGISSGLLYLFVYSCTKRII